MKINHYSREGFTLIELLIVIAIIGILVTVAVIAINPSRLLGEANDSKKREELLQIKNALQLYFNDKTDYPADIYAGGGAGLATDYMRQVPTGYSYNRVSVTDYDAGVVLDYPTTSDTQTVSVRCNPVNNLLPTITPTYAVCPD